MELKPDFPLRYATKITFDAGGTRLTAYSRRVTAGGSAACEPTQSGTPHRCRGSDRQMPRT